LPYPVAFALSGHLYKLSDNKYKVISKSDMKFFSCEVFTSQDVDVKVILLLYIYTLQILA